MRILLNLLMQFFNRVKNRKVFKKVPSQKSQRSREKVSLLKEQAQKKRDRKAVKRYHDYQRCIENNP